MAKAAATLMLCAEHRYAGTGQSSELGTVATLLNQPVISGVRPQKLRGDCCNRHLEVMSQQPVNI